MEKKIWAVLLVLVFFLQACGSATRITGSWIDPDAKSQPRENKRVFIASLSRNMEVRTKLESALAREAMKYQVVPVKSTDYFSPDFYRKLPEKDDLIGKIKQTDVDAILTVSLIKQESENRYVPGPNSFYAPFPRYRWYGGFYSYYNYWYPYLYDPGYYVTDKTYFLETNLYDAKTEKLIWSAQSETVNPQGIDNFVKSYPRSIVERMKKDGLL